MSDHEKYMAMAIEEARTGLYSGEDPFGAVIVRNGEVVCRARSTEYCTGNATDQAETGVIGEATSILQTLSLSDCTLYSSCEPCPMRCGAIIDTEISTLVDSDRLGPQEEKFGGGKDDHGYTVERLVELAGAKTQVINGVLRPKGERFLTAKTENFTPDQVFCAGWQAPQDSWHETNPV